MRPLHTCFCFSSFVASIRTLSKSKRDLCNSSFLLSFTFFMNSSILLKYSFSVQHKAKSLFFARPSSEVFHLVSMSENHPKNPLSSFKTLRFCKKLSLFSMFIVFCPGPMVCVVSCKFNCFPFPFFSISPPAFDWFPPLFLEFCGCLSFVSGVIGNSSATVLAVTGCSCSVETACVVAGVG